MAQKRVGIDVDQPELLVDDGQTTLVQTDGGGTGGKTGTGIDGSGSP